MRARHVGQLEREDALGAGEGLLLGLCVGWFVCSFRRLGLSGVSFVISWVMTLSYPHINAFTLLVLKRSPSPMDLLPGGVLARSCFFGYWGMCRRRTDVINV